MALPKGKQGMTKALKRAARLHGMEINRKRDKSSQRSDYHRQFDKAPGPHSIQRHAHGFIASPQ